MNQIQIIENAIKSLEWAAAMIKDIPPNSHYMQTISDLKLLLNSLKVNEPV